MTTFWLSDKNPDIQLYSFLFRVLHLKDLCQTGVVTSSASLENVRDRMAEASPFDSPNFVGTSVR